MEGEAPDSGAPAAPQCVVEQAVGVSVLARAHVVGLVVEHRIDLGGLDELVQVDHLAAVGGGRLDLLLVQHHVCVGRDLVALDDLPVGDLAPLLGADAPVLDPCARP